MAKRKKLDPRAVSDIDRAIGARIRARRVELGRSQEALGEEIGVTFQQIQKYERGVNRVSAAALVHIAGALKIKVLALMPAEEGAGAERTGYDDPDARQMIEQFSRLNGDGKRVLSAIVRALAADAKLRVKP